MTLFKPGISSQPRRPVTALQNIPYTAICFKTLKVPSNPLFPKLAKQNSPAIVGLGRDNPNVHHRRSFDGSKTGNRTLMFGVKLITPLFSMNKGVETEHYVSFSLFLRKIRWVRFALSRVGR